MENEIVYYIVQDCAGNVLQMCNSLSDADTFKASVYESEQNVEEIYIIGLDINGKEITPQDILQ